MGDDFSIRKGILWGIGAMVLVFALVWFVTLATFGMRVATAGLFGRGEAHIQIQSAAFRIAAYEQFFNRCAAVQSHEGAIDALLDELDVYEVGSKNHSRTMTNLTGVKAARAEAIALYNAAATKSYTAGQFRDSDLPYQLPTEPYQGRSIHTTCAIG